MSEFGKTLRQAREAAGLSLSGMSRRTGYSPRYLGNVETGARRPTPKIIRAYERALGEDLKRRAILLGLASGLATATTEPDIAVDVFRDIAAERSTLLSTVQTSHDTDKMISYLVGKDLGSVGALSRWTATGNPILRVNSIGILAKLGSPVIDNDVVTALRQDSEARQLYLTAVARRVLSLPWEEAARLASGARAIDASAEFDALSSEVGNMTDCGARWCSTVLLARLRPEHPHNVDTTLKAALRAEPARENLRTIACVLAGLDPLTI